MRPTFLLDQTPSVNAEGVPPAAVHHSALLIIAAGTVGGVLGYLLGLGYVNTAPFPAASKWTYRAIYRVGDA